jgi:O-antigen/teichoic acid export membrane protein
MSQTENLIQKAKAFSPALFFTKGHSRSIKAKKNIAALVLIKGVSVLTSFILVPLTINYLSPVKYGIWLTMFGIVGWFGLLDIGLGNGLRNKFAESVAAGDKKSARIYLSTSYALLGIIMSVACLLFFILNQFLDWSSILNVSTDETLELGKVAAVIFGFFCMQLVVKLISSVLLADQKAAFAAALNTICSLLSLVTVFVLTKTAHGSGSLLNMALAIGLINVIVPLLASFWFFATFYKEYRPSFKQVNFKYAKGLMNVGAMFFLFQSTALIVVATDNIIISQLFGPADVTPYNIALKYFTPVLVIFNILSTPLWSAYTEAYAHKDTDWIRRITGKMIKVWLLLFIAIIPMLFFAELAYEFWVGKEIKIPFILTAFMAVYVMLSSWNQIFGNFINGIGKLRLAFYLTIVTAVINIPLCIFLAKYAGFGVAGIIAASSLSLIPDIIFLPIQYYKIVKNKATGIWNK